MTTRTKAARINEREIVLDMLLAVEEGRLSHQVLRDTLTKYQYLPKASRGFLTRLFEGTLEYRYQIDWELNVYCKGKPVAKQKPLIRTLLRMGVYQILYMDQVPDAAACNEAVKLAEKRGFAALKGFVNGVLRRIAREKEALPYPDPIKEKTAYLAWQYSMPEWIAKEWQKRFGEEQAEQMLAAELCERPVTVHANAWKTNTEELKKRLLSEGVQVKAGKLLSQALELSGYDYLNALPSFQEGLFQVQDESSMLAVLAAGLPSGHVQILDVCAAPGGKSLLLAGTVGERGQVTARDISIQKVELLHEAARRCGCPNLTVECQDALVFDPAWEGRADLVFADLPCSGLGVMARKRDLKYRIRPEDCKELAVLQRQILSVVRNYVKPGGILLYCTCTISQEENEENVAWMEQEWKDFSLEPLFTAEQLAGAVEEEAVRERLVGEGQKGYLQLCPGVYPTDGFFIAKLRRSFGPKELWSEGALVRRSFDSLNRREAAGWRRKGISNL